MNSIRRIAHLDMDAFFASVELLRYPELRGQPVVVGGRNTHQPVVQPDGSKRFARLRDYVGRGVITTSTYEARALGVFSGMGLMKSAQLAPGAILLPANFDAYREYSRRFKAAVASIAPQIEDRGIDEIYIDLSAIPEESSALARRIKQAVFDATGLTCSIGITPNKLLSKICSDLDKPNGITILGMEEIAARIWPLPAKKINGIGPKATRDWHSSASTRSANWRRRPSSFWSASLGAPLAPGCTGSRMASMTGQWLRSQNPSRSAAKAPSNVICMPGRTGRRCRRFLLRCACAWPMI